MGRGPKWTDDEERILRYMWENKDVNQMEVDFCVDVSKVLKLREPTAIDNRRKQMGLTKKRVVIQVEKMTINKPIKPPKHSDNFPDLGLQMTKVIDNQFNEQEVLKDIAGILVFLRNSHVDSLAIQKEQLAIWREVDARGKASKSQ